jgi:DNA-binding response OmpR family regulator
VCPSSGTWPATRRAPSATSQTVLYKFCIRAGPASRLGSAVLLNGFTVLLVEEDRDNLELLSAYLQLEGATVLAASSAAAALETPGSFDAVISELLLGDGDGCDLLPRLRAQAGRESVPALALTALTDADWKKRALQAGFNHCAIKPVPLTELTRLLLLLCRRR